MIRVATQADLPQVVVVHQAAFKGFLMTELGPRFLRGYYQQVLAYPHHLFLVWQSAGEAPIEGFVAGFLHPHAFYQQLRARKWSLALGAATHLICHPHRWGRVLASLRRAQTLAQPCDTGKLTAELASLAVLPQSQGKGIGKVLTLAFLQAAQDKGAQRVYLTTDALNNDAVNAFYQRLGFRVARQFWHTPQRLMNEYVYDFADQQVAWKG
jgi:ribosomal protein S18 acetylase RimI-like enzyme